jgi:hypothetical protein
LVASVTSRLLLLAKSLSLCRLLLDGQSRSLTLRGTVFVIHVLHIALCRRRSLLLLPLALRHHALHILLWRRRRSGVCRCIRLLCLPLWVHRRLAL